MASRNAKTIITPKTSESTPPPPPYAAPPAIGAPIGTSTALVARPPAAYPRDDAYEPPIDGDDIERDAEVARNELPPMRPPLAASASAGATSAATAKASASAGTAARSSAARHQGFSVAEEAETSETSPRRRNPLGVSASTGAARRNDARRTSGDARRDTRAVPADRDDADDTTRVRRTVGLP